MRYLLETYNIDDVNFSKLEKLLCMTARELISLVHIIHEVHPAIISPNVQHAHFQCYTSRSVYQNLFNINKES